MTRDGGKSEYRRERGRDREKKLNCIPAIRLRTTRQGEGEIACGAQRKRRGRGRVGELGN